MADEFDAFEKKVAGRKDAPAATDEFDDFERKQAIARDAQDPDMRGVYRMFGGDPAPLPAPPSQPASRWITDPLEAAAYGIVKGGADLASLPGLTWDLGARAIPHALFGVQAPDWALPRSWGVPANRHEALQAAFAPLGVDTADVERYRPDTWLGSGAQSVAEFVPAALSGGGPLWRYAAIPGAAGEIAGQTAENLYHWSPEQADMARAAGGALGAGGPAALKLAGHALGWTAGHVPLIGEALRGLAQRAFRAEPETIGFTKAEQTRLDHAARIRAAGGDVPENLQAANEAAIDRISAIPGDALGTPVPKPPSQAWSKLLTTQEGLRHGPLVVTVPAPPRDRWDYR